MMIVCESFKITPLGGHYVDFPTAFIPIRYEDNLCVCVNAYHQQYKHRGYNAR